MNEQDIRIGGFYNIKVGSHTTVVRVMRLAKDGKGGWEGITLAGDKDILIRSSSRIVSAYNPKQSREKATSKPQAQGLTPQANKRLSLLDAAVKVLTETNGPLSCKQMLDAMVADGLWTPS